MPICDTCGKRMSERAGRYFERVSGRTSGSLRASSSKRVSASSGRTHYTRYFVCYGCRPVIFLDRLIRYLGMAFLVGLLILGLKMQFNSTSESPAEAVPAAPVDAPVTEALPAASEEVVAVEEDEVPLSAAKADDYSSEEIVEEAIPQPEFQAVVEEMQRQGDEPVAENAPEAAPEKPVSYIPGH